MNRWVRMSAGVLLLACSAACSGDDRPRDSGGGEGGGGECASSCEACLACDATEAACATERDACSAEPDCALFRTCAGETDDPATIADCRTSHPAGAAAFCRYWGCLVYEQCDALCEDAVICPR